MQKLNLMHQSIFSLHAVTTENLITFVAELELYCNVSNIQNMWELEEKTLLDYQQPSLNVYMTRKTVNTYD